MSTQAHGRKNRNVGDNQEGAPEHCRSNWIVIGQMPGLSYGIFHKMIDEEELLQVFFRIFSVRRNTKIVIDQRRAHVGVEPDTVAGHKWIEEGEAQNKYEKERPLIVGHRGPSTQDAVGLHF